MRGVGKGKVAYLSNDDPHAKATFYGFKSRDPYLPATYNRPAAVGTA